jgi:alkylhydroperoxidase family enzyme
MTAGRPRVGPPRGAPPGDAVRGSGLGHQPELVEAFLELYGVLWSHGVVDHPSKEVARLRNARVTGCGYCKNIRFSVAREQGLGEELVEQIRDGYEQSALSERHKAVLRWSDAFLSDPAGASAPLREEMLRHFTPAELVELTAGLALFMGFSKIAVSLGQAPESMPTLVVPTPDWPGATPQTPS